MRLAMILSLSFTSSSLKQLGCCGTALDLELEDVTLAVQSLSRSPHHLAFLSLSVSKMGATIVPPVQADVRIKWVNICKALFPMLSVLLNERSQGKQTGIVGALAFGGALSGASRLERGLQGPVCLPARAPHACRRPPGGSAGLQRAPGRQQSLREMSLLLAFLFLFFPSFKRCWNFSAWKWRDTGTRGHGSCTCGEEIWSTWQKGRWMSASAVARPTYLRRPCCNNTLGAQQLSKQSWFFPQFLLWKNFKPTETFLKLCYQQTSLYLSSGFTNCQYTLPDAHIYFILLFDWTIWVSCRHPDTLHLNTSACIS